MSEVIGSYNPRYGYCAPAGRLPVQGKQRAEIDKIRWDLTNVMTGINDREIHTMNSTMKIQQELQFLGTKNVAEVQLLNQKSVTELAQTSNTIPSGMGRNNTTVVEGIMDKQKGLFQKQTDGFDRDAEQKLAKMMIDTWSVRQTTDGALSDPAGLADGDINSVLDKAKTGINVAV